MRLNELLEQNGITEDDFRPKERTDEDRIKELEQTNEMLLECILEMSEIVYS